MLKSSFLIIIALSLVAGGIWLYTLQNLSDSPAPKFSSYMKQNEELFTTAEKDLYYSIVPFDFIVSYPSYPTNKLKSELQRLHELTKERNTTLQTQHEREYEDILQVPTTEGKTLNDYIGSSIKPLTYEIYNVLVHDLEIIVAQEKIKHDIARPMQIDLSINSPVSVPNTPSYPSLFSAKATLIDSILKVLLTEENYSKVHDDLNKAIHRKQVVGISTKFDTDYGSDLAREFFNQRYSYPESKEFIGIVREMEWSAKTDWPPKIDSNIALPDLVPTNQRVVLDGKSQLFKTDIVNQGEGKSPENIDIELEIDQFADGSIDKKIKIPFGQMYPQTTREAGYYMVFQTNGTHKFRFVVNPDFSFLEKFHHNNYGEWTEFIVNK